MADGDHEQEYPRHCLVHVHEFGSTPQPTKSEYSLKQFFETDWKQQNADAKFRWFHLPMNNMKWAEKCLAQVGPDNFKLDEKTWNWKLRPALSSTISLPFHSIHMEPSCDAQNVEDIGPIAVGAADLRGPAGRAHPPEHSVSDIQHPLATLYLPYMNYDKFSDYEELSHYYLHPFQVTDNNSKRMIMESDFLGCTNQDLPLHPRRTLDQYFYPSLNNTAPRDCDQTLSKWTGDGIGPDGREKAQCDSLLILIDQLWCWVLDDKTIVSFFPSHTAQYSNEKFCDLYKSISNGLSQCSTVWDLYALMFKETSTHLFTSENRKHVELLETYRWVASKKAADQTAYFQEFHQNRHKPVSSLSEQLELRVFLEVADIIDEIKIIRHLINQQRAVLKALIIALKRWAYSDEAADKRAPNSVITIADNTFAENTQIYCQNHSSSNDFGPLENTKILASNVAGIAKNHVIDTEETLVDLLVSFEAVQEDAEYTQKLLLGLLDLQQKAASLAEARSTTKQGGAIMLFTIITVIFLPLSFFTSFFGQNVSEITGDDKNPTTWELWKVATPISVVIIFVAFSIAICIIRPNFRPWMRIGLWMWRLRRTYFRFRMNHRYNLPR